MHEQLLNSGKVWVCSQTISLTGHCPQAPYHLLVSIRYFLYVNTIRSACHFDVCQTEHLSTVFQLPSSGPYNLLEQMHLCQRLPHG